MVRGRTAGRGRGRGRAGAASATTRSSTNQTSPEPPSQTASPAPPEETSEAAPSRSTPVPSRRGTPAGRTTKAPSAGRFRPKNVRRDEAERDTIAREEEKKASDRAAEERRMRGRTRFRSKRSRGDAMGARGGRVITTASGPFSSGYASSSKSGGGWLGGGGGSGGGGGGGGGGGLGGVRGSSSKGPASFGEADVRHREPRINADKLHTHTPEAEIDSEDEAMVTMLSTRSTNVMPMGIYRKEHKEAEIVVATTAELEAAEKATGEEESLWIDGKPPSSEAQLREIPPEEGHWGQKSKAAVKVKEEPGAGEAMELDVEAKAATAEDAAVEQNPDAEAQKPKKVLPTDPEEIIAQTDLDLIASELGAVTVTDENGEVQSEGPANKDGRLYLFQFPPLLPPLKEVPRSPNLVKAEPADVNMLETPPANPDPIDLTQEVAAKATAEGGGDEENTVDDMRGFRSSDLPQGGFIGKLNVHKSGKTSLSWGGMDLALSPASAMNFLTTAVIIEESDEKVVPIGGDPAQVAAAGGDAIGMGKVMGRFVLAPTWAEEEDWEVDPKDLEVPGE